MDYDHTSVDYKSLKTLQKQKDNNLTMLIVALFLIVGIGIYGVGWIAYHYYSQILLMIFVMIFLSFAYNQYQVIGSHKN